jgi:hypothetical protein
MYAHEIAAHPFGELLLDRQRREFGLERCH